MFKVVEEDKDIDVEVHSGPYHWAYLAYCTLSKLVNTEDTNRKFPFISNRNFHLFLINI